MATFFPDSVQTVGTGEVKLVLWVQILILIDLMMRKILLRNSNELKHC